MKKFGNILASFLCLALLISCQYTSKKGNISAPGEYIGQQTQKQIINEDPKTLQPAINDTVSQNPIKIALLVPLSGNYKELGQAMLDAAQLAIFRIGDANLTILPIDTKDSPQGATIAAKQAISGGAKLILGPVFSSGAKAIAKIAAENDIQVVSFSNDKTLAGTGVFAIGSMPQQQVSRIVNFAASKGIKNFTTLLPNDAYGTIISKELQQIVSGQPGLTVVKNVQYQADSKAIEANVKEAASAASTAGGAGAILMPANAAATNKILAALAASNLDKSTIKILGNDQWYDNTVLANPALEGAWFTALPRERRAEFENKFKELYGTDAAKLSSLAYDGIALAAAVAKNSPDGILRREAFTNQRGFIGVDGMFRLQENGLVERGYAVMSVKNGKAVILEAAPTSFIEN